MPFFFVLFTYKDGGCCAGEISTSTSMNKFLIAIDETAYANAQYDVWCSIGNLELVGKTRCILYLFPRCGWSFTSRQLGGGRGL